MIRAVIFDFDGTIANTLSYTFSKIIEVARKINIKEKDEVIVNQIRKLSPNDLNKKFKISWLKLPIILFELKKAQKDLYYQINKIKPFPGIKILLKKLIKNNFNLYIYSSNIKKNIEKFLEEENIKDYFKKIYTGSNLLGKDKDLIKILKKEGLKKDEVVYIGDEIRDVVACKKANIKIISVSWGLSGEENLKEVKADFIAKKTNDVFKIVEKLNKKSRN